MDPIHWKCQCGEEGSGFIPESCPRCENYIDAKLTEQGFRDGLSIYYHIHNRGLRITELLGFGCDSLDFNGQTYFTTRWEQPACQRGCCGGETRVEEIPTRYLWMKDEDILAEVATDKAKAENAKLEKEQKEKLAKAQSQVEAAKARAATAQADAERALAKAAADLAALQGSV